MPIYRVINKQLIRLRVQSYQNSVCFTYLVVEVGVVGVVGQTSLSSMMRKMNFGKLPVISGF
jgi:hypothetical protein